MPQRSVRVCTIICVRFLNSINIGLRHNFKECLGICRLTDSRSTLSCEVPMKTVFRWLSILPAILWPLVIFRFSAQTGSESGSLSFSLCRMAVSFIDRLFSFEISPEQIISYAASVHTFVRKIAHVTEYFILLLCLFLPLKVWLFNSEAQNPRKELVHKTILPSFFIGLTCASLDEFLQSHVPGRCGTPADVLIDSVGLTLGCTLLIFYYFNKKFKCNK